MAARESDDDTIQTRRPPTRPHLGLGGVALVGGALLIAGVGALAVGLDWPPPVRAAMVGGLCLVLWLTQWTPLWFPTVLLWVVVPLVFIDLGPAFRPWAVLRWSADPVLVLFFGGFALAVAAGRWGLDRWLVARAIRAARGEPYRLVTLIALATVGLSMWMSNIAAAALIMGAVRPVITSSQTPERLRYALLLTIAMAANVGGIATPVGSGPNGIAIAAVGPSHTITFIDWMAFGTPLALGLLGAILFYTRLRFGAIPRVSMVVDALPAITGRARLLVAIVGLTVLLWLTEPIHHVPAWLIAFGAVGTLVVCGLLGVRDVRRIDWSTLFLIAGGIGLGALFSHSGLVALLTTYRAFQTLSPGLMRLVLCLVSAALSAVMSNTGTAASLVPLAAALDPSPSTAVLVAVSASMGAPFLISTPPNAMAVANGLRSADLLVPGLLLLGGGCALVAATGPWVLHAMGIP